MEAILQVRLWNAAKTGWSVLPLAADGLPGVLRASGRVSVTEGFADASVTLAGSRRDFPGLVRRRRVELVAVWRGKASEEVRYDVLYRGIVKRVASSKDVKGTRTSEMKLFGLWSEIGRVPCYKRFANVQGTDRAGFFADLANLFVVPRVPGLSVQSLSVGSEPDYVDGYDKSFADVAEGLRQNIGQVATGVDVDAQTGRDRLYFRPFDSMTAPARHTMYLPDVQSGTESPEEDETGQATVLLIRGGSPRYPNLLAEAVQGNTSFESPALPGESSGGNYLSNGDFELTGNGNDFVFDWFELNGAVSKDKENEGVEPFTGARYVELDHVGEEIYQWRLPAPTPLVAGRTYTLDVRARLQFENRPARGTLVLDWCAGTSPGNATVIETVTVPLAPVGVTWDLFGRNVVAPPDANGFRVRLVCTEQLGGSSADYGVLLDDARFFDPSQVTQKGWQTRTFGDAQILATRWDEDAVFWHGSRCVYLSVLAQDANDEDIWLCPANFGRFPIVGGQSVRAGFTVMVPVPEGAPSGTGAPSAKVLVELVEYENGADKGRDKPAFTLPADGVWRVITATKAFGQFSDAAGLQLTFRSDTRIYVDTAFAYDVNAPVPAASNPASFLEGSQYRGTFRADALFAPGSAIGVEAVAVGDILAVEDRSEITGVADAEAYARAYFERFALPLTRPSLETFGVLETNSRGGSTASMMPGESVRLCGHDGGDLMPSPLPLVEKQFAFDGGRLTVTPYFSVEPRDPYRTIEQIIKAQMRRGESAAASGSYGGGGTASSGGGSGGTVTSVGLSAPGALFAEVGNSPVTGEGTLALSLAMQPAGTVFAAPTAANGEGFPTFRALAASDIPALPYAPTNHTHDASAIVSGTIDPARLPASSATTATHIVVLLHGAANTFTPSKHEYVLPYAADGSVLYYTHLRSMMRVVTPSPSGSTTVMAELYQGSGAFVHYPDTNWDAVSTCNITANIYQDLVGNAAQRAGSSPSIRSGDKLCGKVIGAGAGVDGITFEVVFSVSSSDPADATGQSLD